MTLKSHDFPLDESFLFEMDDVRNDVEMDFQNL